VEDWRLSLKGFKPIVSIGVAALNLFSSHGKPRAMVSQGSTARTQLAPEREDPPVTEFAPGLHVRAGQDVSSSAYDAYVGRWSRLFVPGVIAAAQGPIRK
jgi:hypothetical protein